MYTYSKYLIQKLNVHLNHLNLSLLYLHVTCCPLYRSIGGVSPLWWITYFLEGETGEFKCLGLAVLHRQYWNDFFAKVPKNCAPLTNILDKVHSVEYRRDDIIGNATVEVYQSLQGIFSELLGSHDLLAVANASFKSLYTCQW